MADRILIIALCGAADETGQDGPTPLESAATPNLDALAATGSAGNLTVIDPRIPPESDSGAMAVLGYDPLVYYTGRGPLEGLGADFLSAEPDGTTVCFRMNVASLGSGQDGLDRRTARDLSEPELQALLEEIRHGVSLADLRAGFRLTGFGRHRGVIAFHSLDGPLSGAVTNTDPEYERAGSFGVPRRGHHPAPLPCLPDEDTPGARRTADIVNAFVERSAEVMTAGAVNRARTAAGRRPADRIILRDGGDRLPDLVPFAKRYGRSLSIFGQVPAEKGLATLLDAGWISARPRPGEADAEYYGRLAAELAADPSDVVYLHLKACDEAAHDGDGAAKSAILAQVDELFFGPLRRLLPADDLCVVTGDHATPWRTRVHSADPVPLIVSGGRTGSDDCRAFSERATAQGALGLLRACELMPQLTRRSPEVPARGASYRSRAGITFRGIINDLKRNTESAAAELGVPVEVVADIVAGRSEITEDVLRRAVAVWPVNERDFFPVHDDAPAGARVMRRAESELSSRVFQRGGADYYEYRDTAMSRVAMLRPEWIRMLCPVSGTDPYDPAVQWNKGHFLYQFTYFIGSVNYYYEWDGIKYCAAMSTGDSIAGLPYAPHSFAARDGKPAMILALTYGGRLLGDAQHELGALGTELSAGYTRGTDADGSARLLREFLSDTAFTTAHLAAASGLASERLAELLSTGAMTPDERRRLAGALRVSERDLMPVRHSHEHGIRLVRAGQAPAWDYPDGGQPAYRIKDLAGMPISPSARGLELEVLSTDPEHAALETGLHQYCYVLGPGPVRFDWHCGEAHHTVLEPGDSLYTKPFVPHAFTTADGAACTVLVLRIGGKVSGDTREEAALLGAPALHRLVADSTQWYSPSGRPSDAR